jgi:hypothetical protein
MVRFARLLNDFAREDRGQIAVITALSLSAITGIAGAAILYYQGVEQNTGRS